MEGALKKSVEIKDEKIQALESRLVHWGSEACHNLQCHEDLDQPEIHLDNLVDVNSLKISLFLPKWISSLREPLLI